MAADDIQVRDLVEAGLYPREDDAARDAVRCLLQNRPDLRTALAVHRYRVDEEMSVGGAAELAGVSIFEMKDIVIREGVPLRVGPATLEEARDEVAAIRQWFRGRLG